MARYKRIKGGEKNEKSGTAFQEDELEKVGYLYKEMNGEGIHENNPRIHFLAKELGRTIRSVENQLLGYRAFVTQKSGRTHYNSLIPKIWEKINASEEKPKKQRKVFDEFKFRFSSKIKNVLGKDLITDDYVAIFELVKNSFDAHAKLVKIIFEEDKIIIWDDGKGMNRADIINKWLFIAYSAKNEGVEDNEFKESKNNSYRDRINPNRKYAGAKGIGRFSTDRLGTQLAIETRKINDNTYWLLEFDWGQYEEDAEDEFVDIQFKYASSESTDFQGFKHGLILTIKGLRNVWNRNKILGLKHSLEKLINPFLVKDEFKIEIYSERDLPKDEELKEKENFNYRDIVNGSIKNFIFETLNIKTTKIKVEINNNQDSIITELRDRDNLIYKISEQNHFKYIPKDTIITLYYLNRSAKHNFTLLMGVDSVNFGSIFLFNNGFRVFPFGEPENDPFGINIRKSQGYNRYLGSRELIGSVEIGDSSELFVETSSRDGGLIDTPGTRELKEFFYNTLKKLENYVVPILWTIKRRGGDGLEALDFNAKKNIIEFVEKIAGNNEIKLLEYSHNLIEYIKEQTEEKSLPLFTKLKIIAQKSGDIEQFEEIVEAEKLFQLEVEKRIEAEKKRNEAEERASEETVKREVAESELVKRKEQLTRFKASETIEYKDLRDSNHIIGVFSDDIAKKILLLKRKLDKGKTIDKVELLQFIQGISLANEKIAALTRFTTKSRFLQATLETEENIVSYIINYIKNIYQVLYKIEIEFINEEVNFVKKFQPIEMSVVLDNILSNSRKKRAEKIVFDFAKNGDGLKISIRDVGSTLSSEIKDWRLIFEEGITTTNGAGLGLSHVKRIIEDDLNGTITYNPEFKEGFELIIFLNNEN